MNRTVTDVVTGPECEREGLPMNAPQPPEQELQVAAAAILQRAGSDADALLAQAATRQRALGRRVRGLLMTYPEPAAGCAGPMVLVDLREGTRFLVSQPMGPGSGACRGDPQGFAQASGVLRAALDEAPDLVLVNRFGALEAEGGGFAAELLELLARGVPVLTAVNERHLPAWLHFSGGAAVLPAEAAAVEAWLDAALAARAAP